MFIRTVCSFLALVMLSGMMFGGTIYAGDSTEVEIEDELVKPSQTCVTMNVFQAGFGSGYMSGQFEYFPGGDILIGLWGEIKRIYNQVFGLSSHYYQDLSRPYGDLKDIISDDGIDNVLRIYTESDAVLFPCGTILVP